MSVIQKRLIRFLVLGSLVLLISAVYVVITAPQNHDNTHKTQSAGVAGVQVGGPFTLTNHTGEVVTDKSFGKSYRLIYFGFTYCPSVCPTELQKMTASYKKLGELQKEITPIFITVDPERDTVDIMKNYVEFFHPDMVGFTGTRKQIDNVIRNYKVYAAKVQDENATDYTVDHSSYIYFMSPDGRLLRLFRTQDNAGEIAGMIKTILAPEDSET